MSKWLLEFSTGRKAKHALNVGCKFIIISAVLNAIELKTTDAHGASLINTYCVVVDCSIESAEGVSDKDRSLSMDCLTSGRGLRMIHVGVAVFPTIALPIIHGHIVDISVVD